MAAREWVLKRNCSLTPRQLGIALLVLCALSLLVATVFALHGFWLVLCFSVLELSAVTLAFLLYARHAADRERIALDESCLLVELVESERVTQYKLDPRYTQVEPPRAGKPLVGLRARGTRVEVGRFATETRRRELARELRSALASAGQTGFQF
ncbi:MAG TPA: DUF2244 domain-containing protein [Noviherbaspirillum sp.]|nr:DUF2244 domain-containing protein [Noviherbaspirillum sp.]